MLPASARLRARAEFAAAVTHGRRGRSPLVLVHLSTGSPTDLPLPAALPTAPRAGFIVSRSVGGAVVRNRVKRRLRALTAARLDRLPPGSRLVVRALPPAANASSPDLAAALDRALDRALHAASSTGSTGASR